MSKEYDTYLELHKQLEALIRSAEIGVDGEYINTQEMDDLRDVMDMPWYELSDDDRKQLEIYFKSKATP